MYSRKGTRLLFSRETVVSIVVIAGGGLRNTDDIITSYSMLHLLHIVSRRACGLRSATVSRPGVAHNSMLRTQDAYWPHSVSNKFACMHDTYLTHLCVETAPMNSHRQPHIQGVTADIHYPIFRKNLFIVVCALLPFCTWSRTGYIGIYHWS